MSTPVLYEFRFSHFNERARWALDHAGIRYQRATQVPGLHMRRLKAVSGQSSTPVLDTRTERGVLCGSGAIARWAHEQAPQAGLLPGDAGGEHQAWALCAELEDAIGAPLRRALFHQLLERAPATIPRLFAIEHGMGMRVLLRAMGPLLGPMLRKLDGIDAAAAADGERQLVETLDRLATLRADRDYLCGPAFGLADLTAAALLFPVALPAALPFVLPVSTREAIDYWRADYRSHETIVWVEHLYAQHR
ncbi:MAG: glutathione S-transferase N-terminal domain-containing protein [Pseudomonadota bacterium]